MTNYSEYRSNEITEINTETTIAIFAEQATFQGVAQDDVNTITHNEDSDFVRAIQVSELQPSVSGVSNTDLDFDLADEGQFTQEDSVSGTDFTGGRVYLHFIENGVTYETSYTGNFNVSGEGITSPEVIGNQALQNNSGIYYSEIVVNSASSAAFLAVGVQRSSSGTSVRTYLRGTHFTSGSVFGIVYNTNTKQFSVYIDNVFQTSFTTGGSSLYPVYAYVNYGSQFGQWGSINITLNPGDSAFTYDPATYSATDIYEITTYTHPTSQPYYVTTTDANHLDLSNIGTINSVTITSSEPANTTIKWLVSFDGRVTWLKWSGSAWTEHTGGLADLQNGNTTSELQTGMANYAVTTEAALDFAFDLSSTNASASPSVDQITLNYDEYGPYRVASGYDLNMISTTQTTVTKTSTGTEDIKVNVLI